MSEHPDLHRDAGACARARLSVVDRMGACGRLRVVDRPAAPRRTAALARGLGGLADPGRVDHATLHGLADDPVGTIRSGVHADV